MHTAYNHQHTLPDGSIIEHAHPFRPGQGNCPERGGHQHTEKEWLLYALISDSPVFTETNSALPYAIHCVEHKRDIGRVQKPFTNHSVSSCLLRAPPASFL
jgi:hypothetical protein